MARNLKNVPRPLTRRRRPLRPSLRSQRLRNLQPPLPDKRPNHHLVPPNLHLLPPSILHPLLPLLGPTRLNARPPNLLLLRLPPPPRKNGRLPSSNIRLRVLPNPIHIRNMQIVHRPILFFPLFMVFYTSVKKTTFPVDPSRACSIRDRFTRRSCRYECMGNVSKWFEAVDIIR